jgi:hypothetical protein
MLFATSAQPVGLNNKAAASSRTVYVGYYFFSVGLCVLVSLSPHRSIEHLDPSNPSIISTIEAIEAQKIGISRRSITAAAAAAAAVGR